MSLFTNQTHQPHMLIIQNNYVIISRNLHKSETSITLLQYHKINSSTSLTPTNTKEKKQNNSVDLVAKIARPEEYDTRQSFDSQLGDEEWCILQFIQDSQLVIVHLNCKFVTNNNKLNAAIKSDPITETRFNQENYIDNLRDQLIRQQASRIILPQHPT